MKKEQFEFNELPYPTLARFGLTQEMIEDLPLRILKEIGKGGYSPVLPMRVTNENGEVIESRSRFAFIRMDSGEVDVVFYPTLKSSQIDEETKQVMYVPTPIIARNLKVLAEVMHFGTVEVNGMQHGEPLTVAVDGEPVTVGIDLHNKTGIRFCAGDAQKWKEQPKREWDKYTFGCYGCWVMDDDGNLDYVPEEEYTEELWNEQKKSGERNRAAGIHK